MPEVIFHHPAVKPDPELHIRTGADNFVWSYVLNTQQYPTYGGMVIQVLSAYIDDITITGTLDTYRNLEDIYRWFISALEASTPGTGNSSGPIGEENQSSFGPPITIQYPERGWQFTGYPKTAAGFKLDRDTTAPTWQIQIAVIEGDQSVNNLVTNAAQQKALATNFKHVDQFGQMSADIGFRYDNPFVSPSTAYGETFDPAIAQKVYQPLADFYRDNILMPYSQGNLQGLDVNFKFGSGPTPAHPAPNSAGGPTGPDTNPPPPPNQPPPPNTGGVPNPPSAPGGSGNNPFGVGSQVPAIP